MGDSARIPASLYKLHSAKAAGEERSMSCPVLGHRSGWGPHGFSCPPHPFGVSGPFPINLLTLNSDVGYIDSKLRVLLLASFL